MRFTRMTFFACVVFQALACGVTQRTEAPEAVSKSRQGLLMVGCTPARDQTPYCDIGYRTCGGSFVDPLCCYSDAWGEKCHVDAFGNAVVCEFSEIRCGMTCAANLAECTDPVLDGQCHLLFGANAGMCWGNCFDTRTHYCDGNIVCAQGQDCNAPGPTCGAGEEVCGDGCYSPATETCIRGHVCQQGESLCGNTCYPTGGQRRCYDGVLCNKDLYNASCGGVCFNTAEAKCIGGQLCGTQYDGVCNGVCYQTANRACCSGSALYNPSTQSCCDGRVHSGTNVVLECGDCVQPRSESLGGACTTDLECSIGKCSNAACGMAGECVCRDDGDCGGNQWCDTGAVVGIGKNSCKPLKTLGTTCTRGGQCASNCCKLHLATNPFSPVCRPTDKCN